MKKIINKFFRLSDAIDKEVIDKTIRKKYEQLGHIKLDFKLNYKLK